ncbi:MAG: hypothetical protein RLZZ303_244, partial [Candidatus Hydrogenedentota bacterium]
MGSSRSPLWVFAVIVALSAIPPLQHVWVWHYPPEGYVPTGMLVGDHAHHLLSMRAFENGFYSPFALPDASSGNSASVAPPEVNPHSWRYFATPFFIMYALIGEAGRMLGLHEFLWLGVIEGLCGALYLWCAWRFLRVAVPSLARSAFLLFTLGGGVGGLAYLAALALGLVSHPLFERAFFRFAQYGLIEGQYLSPLLHFYRPYYTLPLAFGLAGLTALIEAVRMRCPQHLFFACFLAFFAGLINPRIGMMAALIALGTSEATVWKDLWRMSSQVCTALAAGAGCLLGTLLIMQHPSFGGNVSLVTRDGIHFLPLVYAMLPLLLPLAPMLRQMWSISDGAYIGRACLASFGVVGAVTLFHVVWHGAWLYGGDAAAAALAGNLAWVPLAIWFAVMVWSKRTEFFQSVRDLPQSGSNFHGMPAWIPLWLLMFLWLGLTTSGDTLGLSPQRFMVLTALPMAVVAAAGSNLLPPRWSRVALAAILLCGMTSILVGALFFQGPLRLIQHNEADGPRPFGYLDYALMPEEDARLMEQLGPGRVLPPPWSPVAYSE